MSREDEPRIPKLTNQLFAADDPELQRKAENRQQAIAELGMELFHMFDAIIQIAVRTRATTSRASTRTRR